MPSVLWRCWLGGRKSIRSVKKWAVGCWRGYLERGADLQKAQLMPLPLTVSCFSKTNIGFTVLVPAHSGSSGRTAVKRVCVCAIAYSVQHQCHLLVLLQRKRHVSTANKTWQKYWDGLGQGIWSPAHSQTPCWGWAWEALDRGRRRTVSTVGHEECRAENGWICKIFRNMQA